jgi:hypothetical protein
VCSGQGNVKKKEEEGEEEKEKKKKIKDTDWRTLELTNVKELSGRTLRKGEGKIINGDC